MVAIMAMADYWKTENQRRDDDYFDVRRDAREQNKDFIDRLTLVARIEADEEIIRVLRARLAVWTPIILYLSQRKKSATCPMESVRLLSV
jgi:hypothetical protein